MAAAVKPDFPFEGGRSRVMLRACARRAIQGLDPLHRKVSAVSSPAMSASVVAVSQSRTHTFSKSPGEGITLRQGLGVEGDAHCGEKVKHRARVARDPNQPNLRQVHLIHAELFEELASQGFSVSPGQLGENVTTRGIRLLELPVGSRLQLGSRAVVELTGLRNPCTQLDHFKQGLMSAVLARAENDELIRKAGVMAIVLAGGSVRPGDPIRVTLPATPPPAAREGVVFERRSGNIAGIAKLMNEGFKKNRWEEQNDTTRC